MRDYLDLWHRRGTEIKDLISGFYWEKGFIPHPSVRPVMIEWAEKFIRENVLPDIPVAVNLRRNLDFDTARNCDYPSWIEFFRFCNNRYPVKFIIVNDME